MNATIETAAAVYARLHFLGWSTTCITDAASSYADVADADEAEQLDRGLAPEGYAEVLADQLIAHADTCDVC
jgi:hypothetical protein